MIAIIDYGMGNLASVKKALIYLHAEAEITDSYDQIMAADGVILPGVGAIAPAMEALKAKGLDKAVYDTVASGKPLLGICLGMQLLLDASEEGAKAGSMIPALGVIPGKVVKFPDDKTVDLGMKVPQMGWNNLVDVKGSLLRENDYVYFVHSYYCAPDNKEDVAAYAQYGIKYAAALEHGNVFATQFHPEKSGEVGLQILNSFIRRVRK